MKTAIEIAPKHIKSVTAEEIRVLKGLTGKMERLFLRLSRRFQDSQPITRAMLCTIPYGIPFELTPGSGVYCERIPFPVAEGDFFVTKWPPNTEIGAHFHPDMSEWLSFTKGEVLDLQHGKRYISGDEATFPPGHIHNLKSGDDVAVAYVYFKHHPDIYVDTRPDQ